MTKFYTVFNLSGSCLQMPNKGYLHPHPDAQGYDRAYPIEVPEAHILWKMAKAGQVRIVEGDVAWPTPERKEKVKPEVIVPPAAPIEEAGEPTEEIVPSSEPTPRDLSTQESLEVVDEETPSMGAVDVQGSPEQDPDLARLVADLTEDAEDPEVPELELEMEAEAPELTLEAEAPAAVANAPVLSKRERKAQKNAGKK